MLWTRVPHSNIIAPQFVLQNQIEFISDYEILLLVGPLSNISKESEVNFTGLLRARRVTRRGMGWGIRNIPWLRQLSPGVLLWQGPGSSADVGCDHLTMGRVGPRVTSLGNQSGFEWRTNASHRHDFILALKSPKVHIISFWVTRVWHSWHMTPCVTGPGPGCCAEIISANPDPSPGIAGNFQPSHDVTWSSQSDLGSH